MGELSPLMRQYNAIKEQNPGALLFFRLGDFYELFFDDAKVASRELDLVLTGRDCGLEERAPMCGVPFHSYENYVARLVAKGYKIAICEQMEDPALAKGLVKREVIRVITPGTIVESYMLDESRNNYLCVINFQESGCGICFADVSTGEVSVTQLDGEGVEDAVTAEISRFSPSEILVSEQVISNEAISGFIKNRAGIETVDTLSAESLTFEDAQQRLEAQFSAEAVEAQQLLSRPLACGAVCAMLDYLGRTQIRGIESVNKINYYEGEQFMRLDAATKRNLELTETMRTREKKGSLLGVLDRTKTPMGKRLLRTRMERPLISPTRIHSRLNAVEAFVGDTMLREDTVEILSRICDMERLITKISCGSANARELRALATALENIPPIRKLLEGSKVGEIKNIYADLLELDDIKELIENSINEDPPLTLREGNLIKSGYSEEVDQLRNDMTGGKGILASVEAKERELTGIPKLKIGYNRVFGYYIEVSNSYKAQVPETYIRKQTLANCERYITQELKEIEGRVLGASDRLLKLEYNLFDAIRKQVAASHDRIQRTAAAIARLDVYCALAEVAVRNNYCRPNVNDSGNIILKGSRHPVVEEMLRNDFVPNDVLLDKKDNRVAIITGPNMAGKSTYMRQTALIVFMAQMGSFVPAQSAEIGIVDSIFTRVGASDDLASGQSTFMVEMNEVAYILENATENSLLILDEIGRGTSTFDGMSIARAVLEFVANKKKLGAKALFATHYHELTVLEDILQGVKNYNIVVKKHGDDITFLRMIVRGGADDSYGIEVAKLAGLPDWVITRSKAILAQLEAGKTDEPKKAKKSDEQLEISLQPPGETEAIRRLSNMDINSLTPLEALKTLDELINLVK